MRCWRSRRTARRAALAVALAFLGGAVTTTVQPVTASASGLGPTGCIWNLGYVPTLDSIMSGHIAFPAGSVDIGTGAINWNVASYRSLSWAKEFMSLAWILSPLRKYVTDGEPSSDQPYLDRTEQIAGDFIAHIPVGGGPVPQATWSAQYAGERADVFGCIASVDRSFAPAINELKAMGPWLADPKHDPGVWNQGVDFRLGGLASGCITGNSTWASLARTKLIDLAETTIDSQGAPIEQSTGYGQRLISVFTDASQQIANCFGTSPSQIGARMRALSAFLAWASEPDGNRSVLGDSSYQYFGTPEDCSWNGFVPLVPPQTGTSKTFSAGYAFGHTAWWTTSGDNSAYAASGYYSVRFGAGRAYHGHDDHQALTWYARSNPLLIDSGYAASPAAFATYARLPDAHSVLTEPGVAFSPAAATTLTRSRVRTAWQSYELSDTAYGGRARVRDVLIDLTAGIVVVEDRASRATSGAFTQLWHLPVDAAVSVSANGLASAGRCGNATMWLLPMPLHGQTIALHSTGVIKGQQSPYQGWALAPGTNRLVAAPVLVLRRTGTSARIVTIMTVGPHAVSPRISRTWSSSEGYVYTISNAGVVRHVLLDNSGLLTEI